MKPPLLPPPLSRPAMPATPASLVQQAEVVTAGRRHILVLAGQSLLQLTTQGRPMPELTAGATVRLEFSAATGWGRGQEARVLALAGRTLDPPLTVQVRPAPDPLPGAPARLAGTRATPAPEASPPEPGARPDLVQVLAAVLDQGGTDRTPRIPTPDAGLAARLLQLIRLIDDASELAAKKALPDDLPAEQRAALASALADLRAVAREPTPGLWRLLLLPFGVPGEVGDLRLYLRDDPARQGSGRRQAGSDDDAPPRRAIFEFDFSRLGRCQLDVFCQGRRFDLVLRTQNPLAPDLRRGIEALFVTARDAGGLSGELGFRPYELLTLPRPDRPRDHALTA